MKRFILFIIISLIGITTNVQLNAQLFRLMSPDISDTTITYPGLASNGVTSILPMGEDKIWFGTGRGLSVTYNFGNSFESFLPGAGIMPKGGISAMDIEDSTIWIAGVFDTLIMGAYLQAGGGLSYSIDGGKTWRWIPQPVDDKSDTVENWYGHKVKFLPITTNVQNTTWDIEITDKYVYIVSWAGGLRRTSDFGMTWERVPLPDDDYNFLKCGPIDYPIDPRDPPNGNHNHKGFSVLAYKDTLWVGTAGGINLGIVNENGCISWKRFTAQNSGISGNWVVDIKRQVYNGKSIIWAITLRADDVSEFNALSKSIDGGRTWQTTLRGVRAYSISFYDSVVFACTEQGLYKSLDGENWAKYKPIVDEVKRERIYSKEVFCVFIDKRLTPNQMWVGTGDGVARTTNDGLTWEIFRAYQSAKQDDKMKVYAYPNPFAPNYHNRLANDGYVRIQFYLDNPAEVQLETYNFAMEKVYESNKKYFPSSGDYSIAWTGRDNEGNLVANGVYFCKLNIESNGRKKSYWTKLIIIK
ncbi:MAG: hypothetical protein H0Z29_07150 [Candidatus Marinimicrobia bacterium]|nr:hypothetical protein [Candidatus Neomarinimicrobiota bacterium]